MSIRSLGLGLLVAAAFTCSPTQADELMDVRLVSLAMESDAGEKLQLSVEGGRLAQLRLEDRRGVWLLPPGALDVAFRPELDQARFSRYDQRGKTGFRVQITGHFIEGERSRRGQLAFEFLDGRLVARETWEADGSGYELVMSEPF